RLIKDLREYLKKKLPSYSIPSLFVPLPRMPLNPNGKIDKPALPFPDTAQLAAIASIPGSAKAPGATADPATGKPTAHHRPPTPTEYTILQIFSSILPNNPSPESIPLDESFFDLGGHSILATRLIFEIRRVFVVDAPLNLVFGFTGEEGIDEPSVEALGRAVDRLRSDISGFGIGVDDDKRANKGDGLLAPSSGARGKKGEIVEYGQDYKNLVAKLRE
ncbi:large subunit of alpha-aminoadipate reductase, partial [Marasmius crinis-equi]